MKIIRLERLVRSVVREIAKAARNGALMLARAGGWWQGLG